MPTGVVYQWFGDETDPAANAPATVAATASSGSAPANGQQLRFRSRDFDASTDEGVFFHATLPTSYSSGGTLNISWLTTATANDVVWKTAWVVVHPSSEASPTDFDAAVFGTVTAASAVTVPGTAGYVKQQSITLGVTGAHAGDHLVVYLGRDADNVADTCTADVKLLEPWSISFATV